MAFGINVHSRQPDRGTGIRGTQKRIACECWFTSTGRIMPLMLKIEDEDGQIQTIKEIKVHSQEKNREIRARLIYYQMESRWVLNIP